MEILSVRENPTIKETAIAYFQEQWPDVLPQIYQESIAYSITARDDLPQWYLLKNNAEIIGCAGLITNDFISRADLYPWVCALFIDKKYRGNAYSKLLLNKAKKDAKKFGYSYLYLNTAHIGLYEKFGFKFIGKGHHPWGDQSRIYEIELR